MMIQEAAAAAKEGEALLHCNNLPYSMPHQRRMCTVAAAVAVIKVSFVLAAQAPSVLLDLRTCGKK